MIDIGLPLEMSGIMLTIMIFFFALGVIGPIIGMAKDEMEFPMAFSLFICCNILGLLGALLVSIFYTQKDAEAAEEWVASGEASRTCIIEFSQFSDENILSRDHLTLQIETPKFPAHEAHKNVPLQVWNTSRHGNDFQWLGVEGYSDDKTNGLTFDCYGAGYLDDLPVVKDAQNPPWVAVPEAWKVNHSKRHLVNGTAIPEELKTPNEINDGIEEPDETHSSECEQVSIAGEPYLLCER